MNARVQKVVAEFLELNAEEQKLAVAEIEAVFEHDDDPEEVAKAWNELIEHRAREVLAGRSTGRDGFAFLDELETNLKARNG